MTLRTRDQERARLAYRWAEKAREQAQGAEYKTRVDALGANVLRSGLAAALAFLEREKEKPAVKLLLDQLAEAAIPGIGAKTGAELARKVRELPLDDYLLVTREVLQLAIWMRRAVQATFPKETRKR